MIHYVLRRSSRTVAARLGGDAGALRSVSEHMPTLRAASCGLHLLRSSAGLRGSGSRCAEQRQIGSTSPEMHWRAGQVGWLVSIGASDSQLKMPLARSPLHTASCFRQLRLLDADPRRLTLSVAVGVPTSIHAMASQQEGGDVPGLRHRICAVGLTPSFGVWQQHRVGGSKMPSR